MWMRVDEKRTGGMPRGEAKGAELSSISSPRGAIDVDAGRGGGPEMEIGWGIAVAVVARVV